MFNLLVRIAVIADRLRLGSGYRLKDGRWNSLNPHVTAAIWKHKLGL